MRTHKAIDVAKWFLYRENKDIISDEFSSISNLKLQKLLYYAQGTFLAIKGLPLFNESIIAWHHGPVVMEVYDIYKNHKGNPIPYNGDFDVNEFDNEEQNLLENVYETFGQFSAWKLRDMTHGESPWLETEHMAIISNEKIKTYFEENYIE